MESLILFLQNNKLALSILCVMGVAATVFRAFRSARKSSRNKHTSRIQLYVKRFHLKCLKAYTWVLNHIAKIPVLGDMVGNISYGYKCHEALTDQEAALRTGKVLLTAILVFAFTLVASAYWFKDIVIAMITSFMITHVAVSILKSKPQKFLNGLRDAVEDFLLAYHKSSGNIDVAFAAVAQTRNPVARHFDIMYDYIKKAYISQTPNVVQDEYNAIAPSRFLRNIYAVVYMTYKYGDQKKDGRSALNNNLMEIQEKIGDALFQQNTLLDETAGERWFIIVPVYAIPLLSYYMLEFFSFEGFEFISTFINSSMGYIVSVLCAGVTLICYLTYAKMAERGILEPKANSNWAKKALRYPFIRKMTSKLLPFDSPKRKAMATTIKKSGRSESVDAMQVKRMFISITLTLLAVLSTGLNSWQNTAALKGDIYTGLAKPNYEKVILTQNDNDDYVRQMLEADWQIVKHMNRTDGYFTMTEDEQSASIMVYMKESGLIDVYRGYESYGIQRIQAKLVRQQNTSGLINLVFVIIMALIGYFLPYMLVYLQSLMNKDLLLIDETGDLQKMSIMLMEYPQTTPDSLLSWYASSAMLMAPQLRECSVTHDFDALVGATKYKPFIQVATCLQMAFNGLPLKDAFSGVEQRLLTQQKEQNRVMEQMLKFRTDTVEMMTNIAMYAVLGLYMFMPLLIAMIQMFMSLDVFSGAFAF